jgi:endonuclease/exonuclease/phosphatase family metal-dependent hydrolase
MTIVRLLALLVVMTTAAAAAPAPSSKSMRLMSYNLNYANPDAAATMDAIAAADADVVLLQEVDRDWQDALAKRFAKTYPHQVFRLHGRAAGGLAVLSKIEISEEEVVPSPPDTWFPAQRLVVDGPFGKVQMLNVHLRPAIDKGSWLIGYQTTPPLRLKQAKAFFPKLATGIPTVVAGDFNELPEGSAVEFFAKNGLVRVPTKGPTTWHYAQVFKGKSVSMLSMDIDHILVDSTFAASDARVIDAGASDHRPVVITLGKK